MIYQRQRIVTLYFFLLDQISHQLYKIIMFDDINFPFVHLRVFFGLDLELNVVFLGGCPLVEAQLEQVVLQLRPKCLDLNVLARRLLRAARQVVEGPAEVLQLF